MSRGMLTRVKRLEASAAERPVADRDADSKSILFMQRLAAHRDLFNEFADIALAAQTGAGMKPGELHLRAQRLCDGLAAREARA